MQLTNFNANVRFENHYPTTINAPLRNEVATIVCDYEGNSKERIGIPLMNELHKTCKLNFPEECILTLINFNFCSFNEQNIVLSVSK